MSSFRGFNKTLNKWVYGYLLHNKKEKTVEIQNTIGNKFTVDKESVGQHTGFYDANSTPIYDGDIVIYENNRFKISNESGSFNLVRLNYRTNMYKLFKDCWNDDIYPLIQFQWNYGDTMSYTLDDIEIIGNIFEE